MGEATETTENSNHGEEKHERETGSVVDELLHKRIINQIEYYFGDINLTRDKFLQEQIKLDDGWIPMDILLKFNRLASICSEKKQIIQALEKSELMEVNEDQTKIRRTPEKPFILSEDNRKLLMKRTVYCKGFPLENVSVDDALAFFQNYGKVDSVVLRHWTDRNSKKRFFKGSVFVVFSTVEEAAEFLKQESVKHGDTELIKMWQEDYIEKQRKERLEQKLSSQKRRKENKQKKNRDNENEEEEEEEDKKEDRDGLPRGAVVHMTGLGDQTKREEVKEAVENLGFPVAYVDFSQGDPGGWLRLEHANSAQLLVKKLEESEGGKLKVGEVELDVRLLEGEEETNFLERVKKEMMKRRFQSRRKGRGGRANAGRGRKRRNQSPDSGPASKQQKE